MQDETEIEQEARRRGISRLCHFTPSRKLAHILEDNTGILSTLTLTQTEADLFDATDSARLDGHPSHISCSIEYPNSWYFRTARRKERLFQDWVILLIEPRYLWRRDTLFCPRNAAAHQGQHVKAGIEMFQTLFIPFSEQMGPQCPPRSANHLPCCPTDDQAEVLVADKIALADIRAIVTSSTEMAYREWERLRHLGIDHPIEFVVAPVLFDAPLLATTIRKGQRPQETPWTPPQ